MSMHPRKPIKKPPAAQVKVSLRDADTIKCGDCDNSRAYYRVYDLCVMN